MMKRLPHLKPAARQATAHLSDEAVLDLVADPIIIVSAPRSGSTLLFEQVSRITPFWSIGGESHGVFREFPHLRAENAALDSMALDERHADDETVRLFRRLFLLLVRNHQGIRYLELPEAQRPSKIFLIEKTPRNSLNIPFLLKVFPKAHFVLLRRDPRQNISSLIEAWSIGMQRGNFVTFRDLPNWHLPGWCFLLPKGWQAMRGKSVPEIAAFQWAASNHAIMDGLSNLDRGRWMACDYASFIADPGAVLNSIRAFASPGTEVAPLNIGALPLSRSTVSQPHPDKWRRHEKEIELLWSSVAEIQDRIERFCAAP